MLLALVGPIGCDGGSREPEVKTEVLGGNWEIDRVFGYAAGHSGIHAELVYRDGDLRVEVADWVHQEYYLGEDCVLVKNGTGLWKWRAACGGRELVEVGDEWSSDWKVRGEALVKTFHPNEGGEEVVASLSFAEIRALAQAQRQREPPSSLP